MLKLEQNEIDGDEGVLNNTTFTTKHTFIGYVTEDRGEYEAKSNDDEYNHIVHVDRTESESSKTKRLQDTLKISQVQGHPVRNPDTGKWMVTKSDLPCACVACRTNPLLQSDCYYKDLRNIQTVDIEREVDKNAFDPSDPFSLKLMTVQQLKEQLIGRSIYVPSRLKKKDLIFLLTDVLETEAEEGDEGEVDVNSG